MVAKAGEAAQPIGSGRVDVADKDAIRQQGSDTYTHTHTNREPATLWFILYPFSLCFFAHYLLLQFKAIKCDDAGDASRLDLGVIKDGIKHVFVAMPMGPSLSHSLYLSLSLSESPA